MEFKAPTEVLDFQQNWAAELDADTISTSTWVIDSGITKDSDSKTDTTATIIISGGTEGKTYKVVNTIVTASNPARTHVKEWFLRIQHQRAG